MYEPLWNYPKRIVNRDEIFGKVLSIRKLMSQTQSSSKPKVVTLLYFTDPIRLSGRTVSKSP